VDFNIASLVIIKLPTLKVLETLPQTKPKLIPKPKFRPIPKPKISDHYLPQSMPFRALETLIWVVFYSCLLIYAYVGGHLNLS
jgi:hypothetical protein